MRKYVLIYAFLVIFLIGCSTPEKIQDIVKQTEQGKKFLEQYPNAEFKAVKIAESLIAKTITAINKNCGEEIEIKPYWKVTFYDPDSDKGIISYVDMDNNEPVCIYSYSKNVKKELPTEPEKKETTKKTCQELGGYVCSAPDDCGTKWLDSSDSYCCPIKCGTCKKECVSAEKCKIAYCSKETNYQCELKQDNSCKKPKEERTEEVSSIPQEKPTKEKSEQEVLAEPKNKEPAPKTILPVVISPSGESQIFITSDTLWTKENSPYLIKGNLIIKHEATLTIEPGTEVRFEGNPGNSYEPYLPYVSVQGALKAIGRDDQKIIFTSSKVLTGESIKEKQSPYYGYWGGIRFMGGLDFGDNIDPVNKSIISNAIIEYSGKILIQNSYIIIENSIFRKNHFSIQINNALNTNIFSPTILRNNLFEENDGSNQVIDIENSAALINYNILRNNNGVAIRLRENNRCINCITIENNLIEKNMANDGGAIILEFDGNNILNFQFNTIKDNTPSGIILRSNLPIKINFNNIYSNGQYELKVIGIGSIDATNNYWGTIDTNQMDKLIYDSKDYPQVGTVSYAPILTEKESRAP